MMEEWKKIELGIISDFKNGINFERNQKGVIGVPTIDVKNMYTDSCYVNTQDIYSVNKKIPKDYYLQNDDLLFVRSSLKEEGVGWTSLYNGEPYKVTYCGFIIRARLFEKYKSIIDAKFLTYFFRTDLARKELVSGSGRVAITNINQGLLSQIKIPVPPLPEQHKIAYILSTVQKAIEQQDKLIRHTTELKKALMQKLFTQGTKNEKQKQTEIGLVPESWAVKTIGEMYDFTSKPRGLNIELPVPFIPMDIVPLNEIYIKRYELRESLSSGTYVENGDLLLAKITPSFENGKQGIVSIDKTYSYATTEVIPLKGKDEISDKFYLFYYLLKDDVRKPLTDKMEGSTGRQRLSKTILGETLIPKPPISEQEEIARIFLSFNEKLSFLYRKKQTLSDLFKTLLHELMTGERRVNEIEFEALTKEYKIIEQPLSMAAEK